MAGNENDQEKRSGMAAFSLIWVGQLASIMGTVMVQFGLMYWAWIETGQATALALIGFFAFVPQLILQPFAGAMVDRWNRKVTIIISDLMAGLGTVILFILHMAGVMELWHVYAVAVMIGAFSSFHFPAFSAAVTMIVAKKNYGRAASMLGLAGSVAGIFGPPLAAVLLIWIGLSGIFLIDIFTFSFAVGILLLAKIPEPERAGDMGKGFRGILKDSAYGFKYIFRRKPLLGLQLTYFGSNFFGNIAFVLLAPMVLAITFSNSLALGTVMSAGGIGGLLGGLAMSAWGGSKRKKVRVIMAGILTEGICIVLFSIVVGVPLWAAITFILAFSGPFVWGSSQAIWQSKVEPNKQGRVFAARGVIAMSAGGVGMAVAGPLADRVFEPAMTGTGFMARTFGWLVGNEIGSGMRLIMLICGIGTFLVAVAAISSRKVRNLERIIPDADSSDTALAEYGKNLSRARRRGRITVQECRELYRRKKQRLAAK